MVTKYNIFNLYFNTGTINNDIIPLNKFTPVIRILLYILALSPSNNFVNKSVEYNRIALIPVH